MTTKIHQKAQVLATKRLRNKYNTEYKEMYRDAVTELGGTPRASVEERIAKLQAQIAKLEAK